MKKIWLGFSQFLRHSLRLLGAENWVPPAQLKYLNSHMCIEPEFENRTGVATPALAVDDAGSWREAPAAAIPATAGGCPAVSARRRRRLPPPGKPTGQPTAPGQSTNDSRQRNVAAPMHPKDHLGRPLRLQLQVLAVH